MDWDALAIVGPTASGKTALALHLAAAGVPIEIISLDSALVYQGMDIGTAKPTLAERAAVPHHFIDIIAPTQSFSAAEFAERCRALLPEIRARGCIPVIVGGTMMYHHALLYGIDDMPEADVAVRAEIETMAMQHGWPYVHTLLSAVDQPTAARLKPTDAQRIQRAFEVYRITGKPISSFQTRNADKQPRLRMPTLSLEPLDRGILHANIAKRFSQMLNNGLLDELKILRSQYVLEASMPSMRCVGYRQAWMYLEQQIDAKQLLDMGIAATRQLAKRQMTWQRSLKEKTVFDPEDPFLLPKALAWFEQI